MKERALTAAQQELADKLTNLQRLTVLGVIGGKSQRQAYYDAGGKAKTDESADATSSEILSMPTVKAFYDSLVGNVASNAILTREKALERLSLIAETRITDILDFETVQVNAVCKDGEVELKTETIWRMKESAELQERAAAAIKSVTMTKFGPKIEMYDAASATAQIAKMQGWDAPTKTILSGDSENPITSYVMDADGYKQARQKMIKNDDC